MASVLNAPDLSLAPAVVDDRPRLTVDEFFDLPDTSGLELIDGLAVEKHMSGLSSWIGGKVFVCLDAFAAEHGGWAFADGTDFKCFGDPEGDRRKIRKPDASYIRAGRLNALPERGAIRVPPDVVVEVISPGDTIQEYRDKLDDYRLGGVPIVWEIEPTRRCGAVLNLATGSRVEVAEDGRLDAGETVPGLTCSLATVLPPSSAVEPMGSEEPNGAGSNV